MTWYGRALLLPFFIEGFPPKAATRNRLYYTFPLMKELIPRFNPHICQKYWANILMENITVLRAEEKCKISASA
jgi:hypothetical protein